MAKSTPSNQQQLIENTARKLANRMFDGRMNFEEAYADVIGTISDKFERSIIQSNWTQVRNLAHSLVAVA